MSHTYSMCRSHLSARIWHSVIILIYCQSHSVSFLIIISLNLWSDSFLCSFFGLILSLVADSGSHVYLLGSKIKQQNKYELLSSHGRLLYTLLQRRVSQHDAMRVLVAFRISLQQHRQCTGRQSEMYTQASRFGYSFPALFMSNSRQRSLAGTQQCTDDDPITLHTILQYDSTRSMRRVLTGKIRPVLGANLQLL